MFRALFCSCCSSTGSYSSLEKNKNTIAGGAAVRQNGNGNGALAQYEIEIDDDDENPDANLGSGPDTMTMMNEEEEEIFLDELTRDTEFGNSEIEEYREREEEQEIKYQKKSTVPSAAAYSSIDLTSLTKQQQPHSSRSSNSTPKPPGSGQRTPILHAPPKYQYTEFSPPISPVDSSPQLTSADLIVNGDADSSDAIQRFRRALDQVGKQNGGSTTMNADATNGVMLNTSFPMRPPAVTLPPSTSIPIPTASSNSTIKHPPFTPGPIPSSHITVPKVNRKSHIHSQTLTPSGTVSGSALMLKVQQQNAVHVPPILNGHIDGLLIHHPPQLNQSHDTHHKQLHPSAQQQLQDSIQTSADLLPSAQPILSHSSSAPSFNAFTVDPPAAGPIAQFDALNGTTVAASVATPTLPTAIATPTKTMSPPPKHVKSASTSSVAIFTKGTDASSALTASLPNGSPKPAATTTSSTSTTTAATTSSSSSINPLSSLSIPSCSLTSHHMDSIMSLLRSDSVSNVSYAHLFSFLHGISRSVDAKVLRPFVVPELEKIVKEAERKEKNGKGKKTNGTKKKPSNGATASTKPPSSVQPAPSSLTLESAKLLQQFLHWLVDVRIERTPHSKPSANSSLLLRFNFGSLSTQYQYIDVPSQDTHVLSSTHPTDRFLYHPSNTTKIYRNESHRLCIMNELKMELSPSGIINLRSGDVTVKKFVSFNCEMRTEYRPGMVEYDDKKNAFIVMVNDDADGGEDNTELKPLIVNNHYVPRTFDYWLVISVLKQENWIGLPTIGPQAPPNLKMKPHEGYPYP